MKSLLQIVLTALITAQATLICGGLYHIGGLEAEVRHCQQLPTAVLQEPKGKMSKKDQDQAINNLWEK